MVIGYFYNFVPDLQFARNDGFTVTNCTHFLATIAEIGPGTPNMFYKGQSDFQLVLSLQYFQN